MKQKKNKFDDLDSEFKDAVASMDDDQIIDRIAQISIDEVKNVENRKQDMDLKEKQESANFAAEQYKEATKANRLKIKYAYFILESRGKV